ncbi:helix-turn-helix domain-containing protein [Methanobacterium sp. SMA-27]|uniref:helix-turn-helix domain-containing protein n=1 Tax=Methanobacterium sp. SMA-27 TaxID=1495336 RepID=UPI00069458C6|nr:helix-turn-helix domain-containing protein [Methanobacterium sp. SMA-27]
MTKNKKSKIKKKQGRPSKLTPELQAEIVLLLKAGNFIETICGTVGINKSTFYDWNNKGKESKHPKNKYRKFHEAVEQAMAWSEARNVALITKHSEENWRAAAWMLSRKHPDKWGKKIHEDFDLDIDELDENPVIISKEELAIIKKVLDSVTSQSKQ